MHFNRHSGSGRYNRAVFTNAWIIWVGLSLLSCAGPQLSPTQLSDMVRLENDAIDTGNGFNAVVMWRMRVRDQTDCLANKHPQFQWENVTGDKADLIQSPLWSHYNYSPPAYPSVFPSGGVLTRHGIQNINSLYLVQTKAGVLTLIKLFIDYKPGSFIPPEAGTHFADLLQRTLQWQVMPNSITHLGTFEVDVEGSQGTSLHYTLRHLIGEGAIKEDTN